MRRPTSLKRSKSDVREFENIANERKSIREKYPLYCLYKDCASESRHKVHPAILNSLKYHEAMNFDMDCLIDNKELPVFKFIAKAKSLK